MKFLNRRGVSPVVVIIIVIVVILAFSFTLLSLNQNAVPDDNVSMTIHTNFASGNVWNGTIYVSEAGTLISVLIPTETIEYSGDISNTVLSKGQNKIEVIFDDIPLGTHIVIFTFKGNTASDAISEEIDGVTFN